MKVEFAINISNERDLLKVSEALKRKGIEIAQSNLTTKSVQLEIDHRNAQQPNIQELQSYIESETGYTTVIKGLGRVSSAVAELRPPPLATDPPVHGVVRLSQHEENGGCLFDGAIGLASPRSGADCCYRLAVHQYGDLSDTSFNSIGEPIYVIDEKCSSSVRKTIAGCDVPSLIGRSIALTRGGEPAKVLSAGIVARASTVELNSKQVCTCSGKTLWQERLDQKQKQESPSI